MKTLTLPDRGSTATRHAQRWRLAPWAAAAATLVFSGCALRALEPGASIASTRERLGQPVVEHGTPDGGRRLLYPMGLQTYALEFDARGSLLRSENVLDEAHFARITPGQSREEVRRQLGLPSRVWGVRYRNQTVWSYSFDDLFCRQFHVGLTPEGAVDDTSFGPDPRCEERRFFPD